MTKNKIYLMTGNKVCLRLLDQDDINEKYLAWLNDPEVTTFMSAGKTPYSMEKLQKYFETIRNDKKGVYFAIIDKVTQEHIGNVKLEKIDEDNKRCEFGILVGEKRYWGKGYATEATTLAVLYAFDKLHLRKVQLEVIEDNLGAVKCYEKVGFKREGLLREMTYFRGKYCNVVCMGLLREELKKT